MRPNSSPVYNPSRGEIIARVPLGGAAEVDRAVQAAARAFPAWSRTPAPARAARMFAFKAQLEAHFEELAALITRENGKTLEEARGDVRRGIEVVEFACGIAHLAKGEALPQVAEHLDGVTLREPLGVCAGITPFNFPAMVPLWMFPLAIACGNTFVLKPSEKVPLTAVRLAELSLEAGLPPGVLNVVHGGREAVDALAHASGGGGGQLRRLDARGRARLCHRLPARQARPGGRRGEERDGRHARRRAGIDDPGDHGRGLRLRRPALHGRVAADGRGRRGVARSRSGCRQPIGELVVDDTSANPAAEMGPVIDAASQQRIGGYIERGGSEGARLVQGGRQRHARPRASSSARR